MFKPSESNPTDSDVRELQELLRRDEGEVCMPSWFTSRLLYEARRRRERDRSIWVQFWEGLPRPSLALALLVGAAVGGGWLGYRDATGVTLHLAEVRYLDLVDPVQHHP